jgi:hypothetical protein
MSSDVEYDAEPETVQVRRGRPRQSGTGLGARQDNLWKAAEVLDNALDGLAHRLGPVLLPERPSPALGSVGQDSPDASEHALFLDNLTSKIESLGRRAGELSERVDL